MIITISFDVIEKYELSTIDHLNQIIIELSAPPFEWWFRGHGKDVGKLTPKIFRNPYMGIQGIISGNGGDKNFVEFNLYSRFQLQAPSLESNLPNSEDYMSWLFIMQHHGLPTRLLDWTASAIVALYFAVSDCDEKHDGELWALDPDELNEQSGIDGVALPGEDRPKRLAKEPFTNIDQTKVPEYPIAISPPMNFKRMVSQQSRFTIHPKPKTNFTIPEILNSSCLARYTIPKNKKRFFLKYLLSLGINKFNLYQTLDALSDTLIQRLEMDYSSITMENKTKPAPPKCGGII